MKRKFCSAALVLALCFVLTGSAWAAHSALAVDPVTAILEHETTVVSADGKQYIEFDGLEPGVVLNGFPVDDAFEPQTIKYTFTKGVMLNYWDDDDISSSVFEDVDASATKTFYVYHRYKTNARFDVGNSNHIDVSFGIGASDELFDVYIKAGWVDEDTVKIIKAKKYRKSSETALDGVEFTITPTSGATVSGEFAHIFTTEEQIAGKYVPALDFDTDANGTITKIKWRFVDPDTGVTRKYPAPATVANGVPILVRSVSIEDEDSGLYNNFWFGGTENTWSSGQSMEGSVTTDPSKPIKLSDLDDAEIMFERQGGVSTNSNIEYTWNFTYNLSLKPKDVIVPKPKAQDQPEAVKAATGIENAVLLDDTGLGYKSTQDKVFTDASVGVTKAETASAIYVTQVVPKGGAVILPAGIIFPLSSKSLDGTEFANHPTNWGKLTEYYQVWKSFEKGAEIDLLEFYPKENELFSFDGSSVTLLATLVVVDDKAPASDPGVKSPNFGLDENGVSKYGVKLVDTGSAKYLLVYDGNPNNKATDPILLASAASPNGDSSNGDSSNGGGCNAGFGLFGLLPLALWVARKRMTV